MEVPANIARGLSDKTYDKRKAAATLLTGLMKELQEKGEYDSIGSLINNIKKDYVQSSNTNNRKGGLIGLAAIAIGVPEDLSKFLHNLVSAIISCFDDVDPRVSYYACESMFNVLKVARVDAIEHLNTVFNGICILNERADSDVKNGAILLDKLLRDVILEVASTDEKSKIDFDNFMSLLQSHMSNMNPDIRQLLIGWITMLKSIPGVNLVNYLPEFLSGLFDMLSDPASEIKAAAGELLQSFLNDVKTVDVAIFGPIISIAVNECRSNEPPIRLNALIWLLELMDSNHSGLITFYSDILRSIMHCVSDSETKIRGAASECNIALIKLIRKSEQDFPLRPLLHTLTSEIMSTDEANRLTALGWIHMLHQRKSDAVMESVDHMLPALLKTLSDVSDEVMLVALEVIAKICENDQHYDQILRSLVQLFAEDRILLESRGSLIVRKLASLLDYRMYLTLASHLNELADLNLCSIIVQSLNLILLTAPELKPLRKSLSLSMKVDAKKEDREAFDTLFQCWCHNPVATFSLCLLAQAYSLSAALIYKFSDVDITVSFLMQIDKLIQLLESPIFVKLRLQLLDVDSPDHHALLKSLYGLLMLLPQSQSYKTLNDRLATISSLQMHLNSSNLGKVSKPKAQDHQQLLERFSDVQKQHSVSNVNREISQQTLLKNMMVLNGGGQGIGPA